MKRNLLVLAALLLLACSASLFAADAPAPAIAGCSEDLTAAMPWLEMAVCPGSFCTSDAYCRSKCPSDPAAFCNFSTGTCSYPSGSTGGGSGSCTHNALCLPGRYCLSNSDCASCTGGCAGYCASDGVCRLI